MVYAKIERMKNDDTKTEQASEPLDIYIVVPTPKLKPLPQISDVHQMVEIDEAARTASQQLMDAALNGIELLMPSFQKDMQRLYPSLNFHISVEAVGTP